jgi:hypothetical protein
MASTLRNDWVISAHPSPYSMVIAAVFLAFLHAATAGFSIQRPLLHLLHLFLSAHRIIFGACSKMDDVAIRVSCWRNNVHKSADSSGWPSNSSQTGMRHCACLGQFHHYPSIRQISAIAPNFLVNQRGARRVHSLLPYTSKNHAVSSQIIYVY